MIGLVLYPVYQSQTSHGSLVKHWHQLDNALMRLNLTLIHKIQILYSKPDSSSRDARSLSQFALASFHGHFDSHSFHGSEVVRTGKLGPCPLIKQADFKGYDMEYNRPGASARVEQPLSYHQVQVQLAFHFTLHTFKFRTHVPFTMLHRFVGYV